MTKRTKSSFLILSGFLIALPALASKEKFTGFYAGVALGLKSSSAERSYTARDGSAKQALGYKSVTGSPILGYAHQFDKLVLGGEASYEFSDSDGKKGHLSTGDSTTNGSVSLDNTIRTVAHVGYAVVPETQFYGIVGWANSRLSAKREAAGPIMNAPNDTKRVNGFVLGAGVETLVNEHLALRLEADHTMFGKTAFKTSTAGNRSGDKESYKLSETAGRVVIAYRF